jgi:hypothetical protein
MNARRIASVLSRYYTAVSVYPAEMADPDDGDDCPSPEDDAILSSNPPRFVTQQLVYAL